MITVKYIAIYDHTEVYSDVVIYVHSEVYRDMVTDDVNIYILIWNYYFTAVNFSNSIDGINHHYNVTFDGHVTLIVKEYNVKHRSLFGSVA